MGKYLDQCAKDAWDVIKGRKKIIGNKIIECNLTDKNIESQEENYGWLAPNGTFYFIAHINMIFLSQEIIKRELLINRKNFSLTILKREI